ncbi:hypothetical protein BHE74_00008062, partial [Ensete ventricosum]
CCSPSIPSSSGVHFVSVVKNGGDWLPLLKKVSLCFSDSPSSQLPAPISVSDPGSSHDVLLPFFCSGEANSHLFFRWDSLLFPLPDGGFGDRYGGKEAYKGPRPRRDLVGDWVSNNNGLVRSLPIYVGGLSLLVVLLNRAFSGIALVTDASRYRSFYFVNECFMSLCVCLFFCPSHCSLSSSQSRADILTLSLSVTNLLTGLVWLSIRPKYVSPVSITVAGPCAISIFGKLLYTYGCYNDSLSLLY